MRILVQCSLALLVLLAAGSARATLHDTTNVADYLIISSGEVIQSNAWIHQLADWRSAHGRTAMVVATSDIYTEFGNGLPSDTTLRDFLFYAYHHWRQPQLRDVFIIGWHDVVPAHVDSHFEIKATDYFYTLDDPPNNLAPTLNVGRLPWSPTQTPQLYNYYEKVVAYETQPPGDWQSRLHLIADSSDFGFNLTEDAEATLQTADTAFVTLTRNYLDYPPDHPWHGDSATILNVWNTGSFAAAPMCRADFGTWGWAMHVYPQNLAALTNGSRLPIVLGMELDVNLTTLEVSSIPQALLSNPSGGAIAYFAHSGYAYMSPIIIWRQNFFRAATDNGVHTLGDLWGRVARETALQITPDGHARWEMLFGDPGLQLPERHLNSDDPHVLQPSSFILSVYPNPFNPSTNIQFELNHAAQVKLEVMNVLGQHVETLLDEPRAAGNYSVQWSGQNHPSGLYFAVLNAGSVRTVRKMMLLK